MKNLISTMEEATGDRVWSYLGGKRNLIKKLGAKSFRALGIRGSEDREYEVSFTFTAPGSRDLPKGEYLMRIESVPDRDRGIAAKVGPQREEFQLAILDKAKVVYNERARSDDLRPMISSAVGIKI